MNWKEMSLEMRMALRLEVETGCYLVHWLVVLTVSMLASWMVSMSENLMVAVLELWMDCLMDFETVPMMDLNSERLKERSLEQSMEPM